MTSLLTDEGVDVSRPLPVFRVTSSGTDLDPDTDDLVNGEKFGKLLPMTHAPETGAINRLHFLAPVFGAGFSYHMRLG